ncbi:MAG: WYL domain-containing protein [Myxococcota bacterium]
MPIASAEAAAKLWISERLGPAVGGVPASPAASPPAIDRFLAALPRAQRQRVADIVGRIVVDTEHRPGPLEQDVAEPIFREVIGAFVAQRPLMVSYRRADGSVRSRRIEPHAILIRPPLWYVLSWDPAAKAARSFRLDRFEGAVPMLGRIEVRAPSALSAELEGIRLR